MGGGRKTKKNRYSVCVCDKNRIKLVEREEASWGKCFCPSLVISLLSQADRRSLVGWHPAVQTQQTGTNGLQRPERDQVSSLVKDAATVGGVVIKYLACRVSFPPACRPCNSKNRLVKELKLGAVIGDNVLAWVGCSVNAESCIRLTYAVANVSVIGGQLWLKKPSGWLEWNYEGWAEINLSRWFSASVVLLWLPKEPLPFLHVCCTGILRKLFMHHLST